MNNKNIERKSLIHDGATEEGALKIDFFIDLLDNALKKFEKESEVKKQIEIISDFKRKTEKLEIVTMITSNERSWIQTPIKYYEEKRVFSLKERLVAYFKMKTKLPKKTKSLIISFDKNVSYPLHIVINGENEMLLKDNNIFKFFLTLSYLKQKMEELKEHNNCDLVGVYEKPYAIIAMNNIKHYTEDLVNRLKWNDYRTPQSIEIQSLFDFISNSRLEFTKNTQ